MTRVEIPEVPALQAVPKLLIAPCHGHCQPTVKLRKKVPRGNFRHQSERRSFPLPLPWMAVPTALAALGGPQSCCLGPAFLFPFGGNSWQQNITGWRYPSALSVNTLRTAERLNGGANGGAEKGTSNCAHFLWTPSIGIGRSLSSSGGMLIRAPVEVGPNYPLGSSTTAHNPAHPPTYGSLGRPYAGIRTLRACTSWYAYAAVFGGSKSIGRSHTIATPSPRCNLPLFVRPVLSGRGRQEVTVPPPWGGGGIAPQICTIVSQCKSASAPLAPLRRQVFSMLFGPSDGSPPRGLQGGGGGMLQALLRGCLCAW